MIRLGNDTINSRWIASVRLGQTPEFNYQVRVRTLDGREFVEVYTSQTAAEAVINRILDAMQRKIDAP